MSFSFSCSFFWGSIPELVPEEYLSPASGIVSCGVNVLPTTILPILTFLTSYFHTPSTTTEISSDKSVSIFMKLATTGNITIISLGFLAIVGSICSICASIEKKKQSYKS
jgi:hypothetical protein